METTLEIWRPIRGYEGLYEVSDQGRIRNAKTKRLLKFINSYGYLRTHLSKENKPKLFQVHRIVARAFPEICGEWFEGCQINHLNEIKSDNRAVNLRTTTALENTRWGTGIMRRALSYSKAVIQLTRDGKFIAKYISATEASKITGVSQGHISACCYGKRKSAGGFIWRFDS